MLHACSGEAGRVSIAAAAGEGSGGGGDGGERDEVLALMMGRRLLVEWRKISRLRRHGGVGVAGRLLL